MTGKAGYGYFDQDAREYVITRPDTPLPWINYIGCKDYLGMISNTAGGYSFYRDARLRRLSRYHYNAIPKDTPGRYVYICDGRNTWNPGFMPTKTELDDYKCRHGLGYTIIEGRLGGIKCSVTYFVPLDMDAEVWSVVVTNTAGKARDIDLFSYVEFCLFDALDDATNFQRNYSIGEVEVEANTIFHKSEYRERRNHYTYFHCSRNIAGFDTSRDAFIGRLNDYGNPAVVKKRTASNSIAHGFSPVGSHQVKLTLPPGQSERLHFVLGYIENPPKRKFSAPGIINKDGFFEAAARLRATRQVDAAFESLRDFWNEALSGFQVEIDDENVKRMVNTWNQYQCMVTFNLSRSVSFFETGISRGVGFRDSNQDILGSVHIAGGRARQRIIDLASTQNSDGSCYHQYQPLTKKGNVRLGTGFSDDALWLIVSTAAYIRETGDWTILDAAAGFQDKAESSANVTLLDHLHLSMRYVFGRLGPHRMPLIDHADWNDCLNLNCFSNTPGESFQCAGDIKGGRAESVMVAELFVYAAKEMIEITKHLGREKQAVQYAEQVAAMRKAILDYGWDGRWFIRAYDNFGKPVGSEKCDEGKIFIETQGWAVMAGIGIDDGKALSALDSARQYLSDENGMLLLQPAYTQYYDYLGEISSYPPGYKENASVFCHNNTWIIIAEAILGRGDRAWRLYNKICPATKQAAPDVYLCEPYCFAQMLAGRDAATPGQAKNSWLTGTASWAFVALTQYILGIRPEYDGLRIDPCIPPDFKKLTIRRRFRGATYNIEVLNPEGVMKGVKQITVNGKAMPDNIVDVFKPGSIVAVTARMG